MEGIFRANVVEREVVRRSRLFVREFFMVLGVKVKTIKADIVKDQMNRLHGCCNHLG